MIKVTIYVNQDHVYTGFDVYDHAGYSEEGSDIVCAAVSTLVINTINAVEAFTAEETSCVSDENTGRIEYRIKGNPAHDTQLLLNAMVLGLKSMEDNREYEPYIDIIFKEV